MAKSKIFGGAHRQYRQAGFVGPIAPAFLKGALKKPVETLAEKRRKSLERFAKAWGLAGLGFTSAIRSNFQRELQEQAYNRSLSTPDSAEERLMAELESALEALL